MTHICDTNQSKMTSPTSNNEGNKVFTFYTSAVIAPATNNAISRCLNLKRPKLPIAYNMTTLSSINPMPIDLVLFLKRNMDMIAKPLTTKTDIDS